MDNLKQCPFCGGNARHWMKIHGNELMTHVVVCNRCGASSGERKYESSAVKAWNRRTEKKVMSDERYDLQTGCG